MVPLLAQVRASMGVAFGAVPDGMVCVNSFATDPQFRQMGFALKVQCRSRVAFREAEAQEGRIPIVRESLPAVSLHKTLGA